MTTELIESEHDITDSTVTTESAPERCARLYRALQELKNDGQLDSDQYRAIENELDCAWGDVIVQHGADSPEHRAVDAAIDAAMNELNPPPQSQGAVVRAVRENTAAVRQSSRLEALQAREAELKEQFLAAEKLCRSSNPDSHRLRMWRDAKRSYEVAAAETRAEVDKHLPPEPIVKKPRAPASVTDQLNHLEAVKMANGPGFGRGNSAATAHWLRADREARDLRKRYAQQYTLD